MKYSIGNFSKLTGLGIHTLRYYEQENLITPERNSNNRRRYSEEDIAWVEFIKRLKDTGMAIKEIQQYAIMRAAGDATLNERMDMLIKHQQTLKKQFEQLQEHMNKLDDKIEFYQRKIKAIDKESKA